MASKGSSNSNSNNDIDYMPLYMSMIAGMSTCLGAAWVLFQRTTDTTKQRRPGSGPPPPVIPPSTMCFSLALAGSVMVTVSVVSIIPECLREEEEEHDMPGYRMIPVWSTQFLYRVVFHAIGYILYFLLAKFAFPEPDEILGFTPQLKEKQCEAIKSDSFSSQTSDGNNEDGGTSSDVEEFRPLTGDSSIASDDKKPSSQKKSLAATRNRRTDKGTLTKSSSGGGSFDGDLEIHKNDSNTNNGKDRPDFFRSFSRYSSGADLDSQESRRAWRVAMLLFLSLTVHNFPEGLAVAASAMESRELGLKVTIGIMVHNIPEGVSIAVPCLAARPDSPWLAFWLSALSGLAEPFGAFVALFALRNIDNRDKSEILNMENVLAFVAGIMIMVAVAELFPEALRHTKEGKFHFVAGTLCGIVLMLATELYLA